MTQVGVREGDRTDFAGPRNTRFAIWPGSVLAKKSPRWVMAAELVETGRLWARVVAPVGPKWVENAASHLLKWSYGEPEWDAARAAAVVSARATLYGLTVVAARRLELSRSDPAGAREIFIWRALVEGDWDDAPAFIGQNRDLLDESQALLQRARRHEVMGGDQALFEFYASRLPADVTSGGAFRGWWRRSGHSGQDGLVATPDELWGPSLIDVDRGSFPDTWASAEAGPLALRYEWVPGTVDDGLHVEVPLAQLGKLAGERLEWQVPGLREELVVALLRSLPKELRRQLVPISEHAKEFVAKASPADGPLLAVLAAHMSLVGGVRVSSRGLRLGQSAGLPTPYLRGPRGRGPRARQRQGRHGSLHGPAAPINGRPQDAASSAALGGGPLDHHTRWDFGDLPQVFEPEWNGRRLRSFPALVDEEDGVSVQVFPDQASARATMAAGTRRLILLNMPARRPLVDGLERLIDNRTKLALASLAVPPYRSTRELVEDAIAACLDEVVASNGGPPRPPEAFEALVSTVRLQVGASAEKAVLAAARILTKMQSLGRRTGELAGMAAVGSPQMAASLDDIGHQLAALVGPDFVSTAGLRRLPDVERHLNGVERRLERLPADPRRDFALSQKVRSLELQLEEVRAEARQGGASPAQVEALDEVRWMIEELRVSFFAQALGTRVPVSEERVLRAIAALR